MDSPIETGKGLLIGVPIGIGYPIYKLLIYYCCYYTIGCAV